MYCIKKPFSVSRVAHHSQAFSSDPLSYVRMQSLALIVTLLCSHPEQEQNLLRLLVNKLVRWPLSCP
jgi:hypothetical protein